MFSKTVFMEPYEMTIREYRIITMKNKKDHVVCFVNFFVRKERIKKRVTNKPSAKKQCSAVVKKCER